MKIKHKKFVSYIMERYPNTCEECPAFKQTPYQCHYERGLEAHCELGFMSGHDMRDFSGKTKFSNCNIEKSCHVAISNHKEVWR